MSLFFHIKSFKTWEGVGILIPELMVVKYFYGYQFNLYGFLSDMECLRFIDQNICFWSIFDIFWLSYG